MNAGARKEESRPACSQLIPPLGCCSFFCITPHLFFFLTTPASIIARARPYFRKQSSSTRAIKDKRKVWLHSQFESTSPDLKSRSTRKETCHISLFASAYSASRLNLYCSSETAEWKNIHGKS